MTLVPWREFIHNKLNFINVLMEYTGIVHLQIWRMNANIDAIRSPLSRVSKAYIHTICSEEKILWKFSTCAVLFRRESRLNAFPSLSLCLFKGRVIWIRQWICCHDSLMMRCSRRWCWRSRDDLHLGCEGGRHKSKKWNHIVGKVSLSEKSLFAFAERVGGTTFAFWPNQTSKH